MKCQWPSSGSGRLEKTCSRYAALTWTVMFILIEAGLDVYA